MRKSRFTEEQITVPSGKDHGSATYGAFAGGLARPFFGEGVDFGGEPVGVDSIGRSSRGA
jgi:hypothetical protein